MEFIFIQIFDPCNLTSGYFRTSKIYVLAWVSDFYGFTSKKTINIAADLWYDFEVLVPQKKNGKKKYLEKKRKKNKNKKNKRGRKMWRKKISSVVGLEE